MTKLLPDKAKFGTPCSGCGYCCGTEICLIGKEVFPNVEPPCPGLIYVDNRLWCKFVIVEEMHGLKPELTTALGIGKGCCTDDY